MVWFERLSTGSYKMIITKKRVFITLSIATLITIIYVASSVYNKTFERMDDIVQFITASNGTENLYGRTDSGKIYNYNHKDGISNAEEVYCVGFYAYVIQSDKIICVPLQRQNKILRFISYHDIIFGPNYKD